MKAIHNRFEAKAGHGTTVVNKAKIQNESNSQLTERFIFTPKNCCQQSKDTK